MSAERYRVTEYQHSGLDFLQIERGGSTHELCAQTDDSMIVGAIRQQSADIDQLRARLASPAHAHLDGEHLNGMVDGCLLCQAITERDQLRADLAAAVALTAARDETIAELELRLRISRQSNKELRESAEQAEARLAAIDAAPTIALTFCHPYSLEEPGQLIARPAKD